jgi:hypothetical protein
MSEEDAIGVVRKHRWLPIEAQRERLQEDGCRVIVDLETTPREWLFTAIRERTIIKAAFAFLLTPRRGVRPGLEDYQRFADRIAKLPRKCHGHVKDLATGLVADSPGLRKAMLSIVREQLMRSSRGLAISEGMRRGRKALTLTEMQKARGEAIWRNVRKFPTWKDAQSELRKHVHKDITRWRAHREWGPRIGAKQD